MSYIYWLLQYILLKYVELSSISAQDVDIEKDHCSDLNNNRNLNTLQNNNFLEPIGELK